MSKVVFKVTGSYKETEKGRRKQVSMYLKHEDSGLGLLEHATNSLFSSARAGRKYTDVLNEKKFKLKYIEVMAGGIQDINACIEIDKEFSKQVRNMIVVTSLED